MATATDPTGRGRKTRTITATDPLTGATLTRATDRVYVAAVVFTDRAGRVRAAAWAGRPDLAAKALAQRGGAAEGYRLAPVTADPWATPTPEPVATPTPEPVATPTPEPVATSDPLTAAAADLAAAVTAAPVAPAPLNPAGGLRLIEFKTATPGRPYLAGDGVTLWAFETEALARDAAQLIAAAGAEPYLAGPGPLGRPEPLPVGRPVGLPPVAPAPVAPYCLAQAGPAAPDPQRLEWEAARDQARAARAAARATGRAAAMAPAAPPAGSGVAAHRAAAAAGRPVSLAALARDLGQSLGLAAGGRVWGPAAPLTGDPLEGQPWDPGTPAARARHAEQGRRAAILWPVAQAITGAGHPLPGSWASDGPVLNGQVGPVTALAALPAALLESAAAALAALPPVTQAQAQALELLRDALAR
jgi:hypothetical protein